MKILYVGDNRNRGNYGCRATSTALSMLIEQKHEIVGRIGGICTMACSPIIYYKYFPSFIYKIFNKIPKWNKVQPVLSHFFTSLRFRFEKNGNFDFISFDMEKSIKRMKKCKIANPFLSQLDIDQYDFDALVINGEGSFIPTTPQWREPLVILMVMYWAIKKNKKVFFMNAMFSDDPNSVQNKVTIKLMETILSKCTIVSVRESLSYDYARKYMPKLYPIIIPDALFSWYDIVNDEHKVLNYRYYLPHIAECDIAYNIDFSSPYILIAGSSSSKLAKNIDKTVETYTYLVNQLKKNYVGNVYLIQVDEGDQFLNKVAETTNTFLISIETPLLAAAKILANSQVFISGRYHPAIMASLGGTPCIFMGSNSHKTYSLQKLLNYNFFKEYSELPSIEDVENIINDLNNLLRTIDQTRTEIKNHVQNLSKRAKMMIEYMN